MHIREEVVLMAKKKKKVSADTVVDVVRKVALLGVGVASLTKDKAEKLTSDLVKKGNITQLEGRKLTNDLIKKSMATKKDMEIRIDKELKKTMNSAKFAKESDVKRLEKKVAQLEKKLKVKKAPKKK